MNAMLSAAMQSIVAPDFSQWVENNLTNIRIFCTDICFYPHGTMLMALLQISVYGCSQMLDLLVSSHPTFLVIIRFFQQKWRGMGAILSAKTTLL
jgi:hypothetical protein